jgi:hypothetical protein
MNKPLNLQIGGEMKFKKKILEEMEKNGLDVIWSMCQKKGLDEKSL